MMLIMLIRLIDNDVDDVDHDDHDDDNDDNHPWKKHARKKQTKDRSVDCPRDQGSHFQHAREKPIGNKLTLCQVDFSQKKGYLSQCIWKSKWKVFLHI